MPIIHTDPIHSARYEGAPHGAAVSLILDRSEPGQGPRLHRHPYDETWPSAARGTAWPSTP